MNQVDRFRAEATRLLERGKAAEAVAKLQTALDQAPAAAELHRALGQVLHQQGRPDQAEPYLRQAVLLKPDCPETNNDLATVLLDLRRTDDALDHCRNAIRSRPNDARAHKNQALAWLIQGEFAKGWPEYEWRWQCQPARSFSQPRWDGKPVEGQTVLLWAEQDLGDTIQFIRYARLVQQRGAVVAVECPEVLKPLLSRCPGIDVLTARGSPLPGFAYHVPLLSLPGIFHTTLETIPNAVPYLSAEPARIESWRARLKEAGSCLVGVAWQARAGDWRRSVPLAHFASLARVPGVRFVSLQQGEGVEQLQGSAGIRDPGLSENSNFADLAALMMNLDLVVTADTAVAHLAGALGVPVWVALSRAAHWRWLRKRPDSPWYPTMRLFRQKQFGDWDELFERIAGQLQEWRPRHGLRAPIRVEITPGELIDRIVVLELGQDRLSDDPKTWSELGSLLAARTRSIKPSAELERLTAELRDVNEAMSKITAEIQDCEDRQDFGPRFIDLARNQLRLGQRRDGLKREIDSELS
jgi:hypothetical protein